MILAIMKLSLFNRTTDLLKDRFYWPKMTPEIDINT